MSRILGVRIAIRTPKIVEDESAFLKIGYKTLWQASPAESPASMADIVQQFFLEQRWPYEDMGEQLYRVQVQGGEAEWVCLVKLDEERQFCLVYSSLSEVVPPKKRTQMALFLAETNYDFWQTEIILGLSACSGLKSQSP